MEVIYIMQTLITSNWIIPFCSFIHPGGFILGTTFSEHIITGTPKEMTSMRILGAFHMDRIKHFSNERTQEILFEVTYI